MTTIPRFLSAGLIVICALYLLSLKSDFLCATDKLLLEGLQICGSCSSNTVFVVSMYCSTCPYPEYVSLGVMYLGLVRNFIGLWTYELVSVLSDVVVLVEESCLVGCWCR